MLKTIHLNIGEYYRKNLLSNSLKLTQSPFQHFRIKILNLLNFQNISQRENKKNQPLNESKQLLYPGWQCIQKIFNIVLQQILHQLNSQFQRRIEYFNYNKQRLKYIICYYFNKGTEQGEIIINQEQYNDPSIYIDFIQNLIQTLKADIIYNFNELQINLSFKLNKQNLNMFGFFGKNRKKDIEKKKNSDEQRQQQADQEVKQAQQVQVQQSKCMKAQNLQDNQFQDNQQLQNQKAVPKQAINQYVQNRYPQTQYEGNLQGTLNYHIIKMIFSYLNGVELVLAKQTCQYFNFLIKIRSFREELNEELKVEDSGIQKYMEVDLSKLKDQNLLAIKVIVSSKDQGWASASYSSSWVTLKLINAENNQLDHCYDSENLDEVNIIENYRVKQFKTHTIIISSFQNKNPKLTQLLKHIIEGNYEKLAIVMKCQYPGWQCIIQNASIEFIVLEKE
ncbi:hypothetical protein pb186bvf_004643 [Paramecium bursaria]